MPGLRRLLAACLMALGGSAIADSAVVTTPQVQAELVAHAPEGLAVGKPFWLGLVIRHQPQWHTYWKNPGDSGLPTTLQWTLPPGISAGEIDWPTPKKLPVGPLMNFGYEGTLLLPVPARVASPQAGEVTVELQADWLVCKDVCIPESGNFRLRIAAQAATAGHSALFDAARAALPRLAEGAQGSARIEGAELEVRATGLPASWQGKPIDFFPETAGVLHNAAPPKARWDGNTWVAKLEVDPQRSEGPAVLPAVLTTAGEAAGLQLKVAVQSPWPAVGAAGAAPLPSLGEAKVTTPAATPPIGLPMALVFALIGGMLLNLMPCVFPVLSLKVVGFAKHGESRSRLAAGGIAYTAGVIVSFMALAGVLLALRAGGEQLGWGFQLQNPIVVAALAAMFTLIGLNLAGVFEFGSMLPNVAANLHSKHPLIESALTGVLAVAVASPCTAPFMGASLGLALTLPAAQALLVFAALGLGMALPYLVATLWPAIAKALPRPGAWMANFRSLMAFPMFGTVVWLVWVLGQQVGIDGAALLLAVLVALAFVAWALGSPGLTPRARLGFGTASVVLLAASLVWAAPALTGAHAAPQKAGGDWSAWSRERVAQLAAQGKPVFVDFTAAWCVTCQFNKRTVLADADVRADFERKGVVLLRADWTRRDPAITEELARLNRSGVPVYALYSPRGGAPQILSEMPSVQELRGAIAALP